MKCKGYIFVIVILFLTSFAASSIGFSGLSNYSSINTNVTQENKFTHLNITDSSVLLYLPFDVIEDSSNKTYDYSNNSNDGVLYGGNAVVNPIFNSTGGFYGGAYQFDGIDDKIVTGLNLSNLSQFTLSMWVKRAAVSAQVYSAQSDSVSTVIQIGYNANGLVYIGISNGEYVSFASNDANWHNLIMVYNSSKSSGQRLSVYQDSVYKTGGGTGGLTPVYASTFNLGYRGDGALIYSNGSIDEVIAFNRALSDTEIGQIYNSTYSRFYPVGEMNFQNVNISKNNTVDIKIPNCQQLNGSVIKFKVNNGSYVTLNSSCMYDTYAVSGNLTNANITLQLNSSNSNFYSPLIVGNITINSYISLPVYSYVSVNQTYAGQITNFAVSLADNASLNPNGQYIFSTNNTGVWVNDSAINFTSTPSWANVTKTLNSTKGTAIGYRWYITDNNGNVDNTPIYVFTTSIYDTIILSNYSSANINITQENRFFHLNLTDGSMVFYMPFDVVQDSSNKTYDYSNNSNDGTLSMGYASPTFNSTGGVYGGDYQFNGSNQNIDAGNGTSLNITGAVTVSAWININKLGNAEILSKMDANNIQYTMLADGIGKIVFYTGNITYFSYSAAALTPGIWYHAVGVYNGTTNSIYLNGVKGTDATAGLAPRYVASDLFIGMRFNGLFPFNGSIDDVMIFNRALSSTEISQLFYSTYSRFYPTGEMNIQNLNFSTNLSIAIPNCQQLNGSVIKFKINDGSYSTLNSSCMFDNYAINRNLTNANITFQLNSSNSKFYSPLILGNINLNSYSDTILPSISIVSLQNTSYRNVTQLLNISAIDSYLDTVLYNWNGTNMTYTIPVNITFSEGHKTLNIWTNDTSGNINFNSVSFTIDITYPFVNFSSPTPQNNSGASGSFIINVSITDTNLANVTLNWNGSQTTFNVSNANITNLGDGNFVFVYTQSGLVIGKNYIYNVSVSDYAGNSNITEDRIIKGNTLPSFISISSNPISSAIDNLDPNINVTISINISDTDNNFESAILQWRNETGDWNNITMENSTPKSYYNNLLSTTFTLPSYETNVTYKIIANDSTGDFENSSLYVLSSYWDCTWSISPLSLEEVIGFYEDKPIGNVTLTNTGDSNYSNNNCSISFTIGYAGLSSIYTSLLADSSNWATGNRAFQYSSPVILAASSNQTFEINASFPSMTYSFTETPSIKITSSINNSITNIKTIQISSTLVVSPPNPLLYQKISTYPSTFVFLRGGNFSLKAYLRNLGYDNSNAENTTAYNVSFNWTLPSELSSRISEGDEDNFYEKLNTSSRQYNNLTISLTSGNLASMPKGTFDVKIYSYGYKNESGNLSLISNSGDKIIMDDTIEIQFLCYDTSDGICVSSCGVGVDPDCQSETPPVTTNPSGGGSSTPQALAVATSADFQLVRGEQNEVTILFENKDSNQSLTDLVFSISGDIAKYIDINPKTLSSLGPGQKTIITLNITSPTYIKLGKQELIITMKGKKGPYSYTDSKKITLEIHELSITNADNMLNESIRLINELNEANLSSDYLNELLNKSADDINNFNLETVRDNYNTIKEQVKYALDSEAIITKLIPLIKSAEKRGIDVSESSRLLELAQLSMERREFEQAYKRVKDSQLTYALEVKGEIGKLGYYIREYPKEISIGMILLVLISFGIYKINRLRVIKKRIGELKGEERILNELIKVVQNECFKEKKISMSEYETAIKEYTRRLSGVLEELIELETKRTQVLRFTSKTKRLEVEKNKIISLIKEMQVDYMKRKKIETRTYEFKMESFNKRLAEIDEKFATLEAKKAIKGLGISLKTSKGRLK